ncbi:hypothetical protein Bca4012_037762 [Brassica carinata]
MFWKLHHCLLDVIADTVFDKYMYKGKPLLIPMSMAIQEFSLVAKEAADEEKISTKMSGSYSMFKNLCLCVYNYNIC